MNSLDFLKESLRPEGVEGPMGEEKSIVQKMRDDLGHLGRNLEKILDQKYMLCATLKSAIDELNDHLDNGEYDQWIHIMIREFEEALKKAVI